MQVPASQHSPLAHVDADVQVTLQVEPEHSMGAEQEPAAVHVTVVADAWLTMFFEHVPIDVHWTSHEEPEQVMGPEQLPAAWQEISQLPASQSIFPEQDFESTQATEQFEPPHAMSPAHVEQTTWQEEDRVQSTRWEHDESSSQSTTQGTPGGHSTLAPHGALGVQ